MRNYYVFLILLIIVSLITGVIISIIEKKLQKEIEAVEDDLQTNISAISLFRGKVSSNPAVTQKETGFNTAFFIPPVITSAVEEKIESVSNIKNNDEVFDAPVLISSEFCEEILEDSDKEDVI